VGASEGLLPPSLRVVHKVPIPACRGGGGCWAISILKIWSGPNSLWDEGMNDLCWPEKVVGLL